MSKSAIAFLLTCLMGGIPITAQNSRSLLDLELFGGLSAFNPKDFNLIPESRNDIHNYYYDTRFIFEENAGFIHSWNKDVYGGFKNIHHAFPFGLRLKIHIRSGLAVSLGARYFSADQNENIIINYAVDGVYAQQFYDLSYAPSKLFAEGIIPSLGIHIKKSLSPRFAFNTYLNLGIILARCGYDRHHIKNTALGFGRDKLEYIMTETGTGKGISIEPGIELFVRLNNKMKLIIGGGYASQKISRISGSGKLNYVFPEEYAPESWSGDWGVRKYTDNREWGRLEYLQPIIDNSAYAYGERRRDMELDLSGLQFLIGFSYQIKSKREI